MKLQQASLYTFIENLSAAGLTEIDRYSAAGQIQQHYVFHQRVLAVYLDLWAASSHYVFDILCSFDISVLQTNCDMFRKFHTYPSLAFGF